MPYAVIINSKCLVAAITIYCVHLHKPYDNLAWSTYLFFGGWGGVGGDIHSKNVLPYHSFVL